MARTDAGGRHAEPKLGTTRSWWHRRGLALVRKFGFLQDDSQECVTNGDLILSQDIEGDLDGAVYSPTLRKP